MSNYIHIDSTYRNREQYPNPAEFLIEEENMKNGWYREPRTVRNVAQVQPRLQEYATTVNIVDLMVPYIATTEVGGGSNLTTDPLIYMDVHSQNDNDTSLIATMNSTLNTARFVLNFSYIQYEHAADGSTIAPRWIHYNTRMEQTMRFSRRRPMFFRLMNSAGDTIGIVDNPIPSDPYKYAQVLFTLEVTPYIRDASYDNHLINVSSE